MPRQRQPFSCVIITRDAAGQLPACLDSVAFADEVLVVDSGSTDGTIELAQARGCRLIRHEWEGFGRQKQFAVGQARHDWVLCLDADERVSEALREAIEAALRLPDCRAYRMPRRNRFLGRWLGHGEGYPDWSLRLFHRAHARWSDDDVHEKVLTEVSVGRLGGDLMHDSADSLARYLDKQNRYTSLQAESLYRAGKRTGIGRLVVSPAARFIKFYILRRGFMDGSAGLVHTLIGCTNSFNKYAKLLELQRRSGPAAGS